ncbi:2-succinyl-5-enolpyruvyl-6-hydroxy-3-cyclohexene-1-carboxylic-acid synthase [Micromonospora sp. HUAS LYJ1]|uniref:2-succinyl-5-enolpyruvyl-6-hydroxy-3- cyclohexene-1-carboxylic-acid synthase n=1 Tax=Micromonospora sp. HUAS LYJ1 TaxID=3061626 RepID=UPI0026718A11|nr:2-succinyl-5-enolpyruvyl-6-hydroxy-3-cyclohexene-1-carboxylic-acid synthase [Micromonospora sp. HUAS LYJ1]WKU07149.1 2-succinyl-5-enolpyruvyl-6-hydroxy-3-cyclohexene-1-carboxylic-acid synthase [Micromonospora sp. HUAS LYJ1]
MNPATALALVLADELDRCGVRDLVLAPGSRSAPLAQAFRALSRGPDQPPRLHVHVDERAAGFMALGIARVTARPVVTLCTSGTAVANLHPAVLEAHHARLPLIVLTADRPPELRDTGASQTTDQIKIYGSAVRLFAEVGTPEIRADSNAYWRSLACQAVAAAASGPVHLNLALREPLTFDPPENWPQVFPGRPGRLPWVHTGDRPAGASSPVGPDTPEVAFPGAARGVVVVGDGPADSAAAVALAEGMGWPLLAEPQSNARYGSSAISCYTHLMAHPATRSLLQPEEIVCVGRPGLSRQLLALLRSGVPLTVVDAHLPWADPSRSASRRLRCVPRPVRRRPDPAWLGLWTAADRVAGAALDRALDASPLTEPRLARDLLAALPDDAVCVLGSSMPIRDVEATMRARRGPRLVANRGLAGIDGTVSTAVGAALAHRAAGGGRAFALLGDLTLLHDLTGLVGVSRREHPDLTIIVVNNRGGGIFSLVDSTRNADAFEELFGTPHTVAIEHLAIATGWRYALASGAADLPGLLRLPGPAIIEVRTERAANVGLRRSLDAAVADALDDWIVRVGHRPASTDPPPALP